MPPDSCKAKEPPIPPPRTRINDEIRAREVRLIGPEGEQLGIMSVPDALRIAQDAELDLVEIAPQAEPPVCRVMDFGKYKYEANKKAGEARKTAKVQVTKELTFRPKIGDHDVQVRTKRAREFLAKGWKVKFTVIYRGRERSHPEIGEGVLLDAFKEISDVGVLETSPVREGRKTFIMIAPHKKADPVKGEPKAADAKPEPRPEPKPVDPAKAPLTSKPKVVGPKPPSAPGTPPAPLAARGKAPKDQGSS